MDANLTQPLQYKESPIFAIFILVLRGYIYPFAEGFRTFLYSVMGVAKVIAC